MLPICKGNNNDKYCFRMVNYLLLKKNQVFIVSWRVCVWFFITVIYIVHNVTAYIRRNNNSEYIIMYTWVSKI